MFVHVNNQMNIYDSEVSQCLIEPIRKTKSVSQEATALMQLTLMGFLTGIFISVILLKHKHNVSQHISVIDFFLKKYCHNYKFQSINYINTNIKFGEKVAPHAPPVPRLLVDIPILHDLVQILFELANCCCWGHAYITCLQQTKQIFVCDIIYLIYEDKNLILLQKHGFIQQRL